MATNIDNVKTLEVIKTEESCSDIPKEQVFFEEVVKKEEEILTDLTAQFIRENMACKNKPSKIVILKPNGQSLKKIQKQELGNKIKIIESSLKGVDLLDFRKIVKLNKGRDSFKHIIYNFKQKLKYKLSQSMKNTEVIIID